MKAKDRNAVLIEKRPYRRVDGTDVQIAVWAMPCKRCGSMFETTTPERVADEDLHSGAFEVMRCKTHRRWAKRAKRSPE